MSAKRDYDEDLYDEDEEEDDEADFVPGHDDDGDEDEDYAVGEDEGLSENKLPPFLQGNLKIDASKNGAITYDGGSSFCLVSQEATASAWSVQSPLLEKSIKFAGWIQDPSEWMEFSIQIREQEKCATDPLQKKLLDAQQANRPLTENDESKAPAKMKNVENEDNAKKAPPPSSDAKQPGLKAPPSYSLKKSPSAKVEKQGPASTAEGATMYSISGSQLEPDSGRSILKFHGVFHPPDSNVQTIFLICSLQAEEESSDQTAGTAAKSSPAAAVAVARKRTRGGDDDDEDSVDNEDGVEYQELIDLHDDAGLSTEELRRRYYGGGGNGDSKKAPASNKRAKPDDDDDEDDDDSAYGF